MDEGEQTRPVFEWQYNLKTTTSMGKSNKSKGAPGSTSTNVGIVLLRTCPARKFFRRHHLEDDVSAVSYRFRSNDEEEALSLK